jgi:hypothetical protein
MRTKTLEKPAGVFSDIISIKIIQDGVSDKRVERKADMLVTEACENPASNAENTKQKFRDGNFSWV